MLNLMTVRCGQCGHENNPEYRFCGMCGATLRPSSSAGEERREKIPPFVSGPSILGLGDEPAHNVDYLLEEEPGSGHGRILVALILLLVTAGFLVWRWRRDGYPWAGLTTSRPAVSSAPTSSPAAAATSPAEPPAPVAVPAEGHAGAAPEKAAAEQGAGSESQVPSTAATVPQAKASDLAPPQASENSQSQASPGRAEEAQAAPTQPAPKANPADDATSVSKSSKVEAPQTAASATSEDKLAAEGERYLYGNGVPQNCDRAQRNLLSAAQHANAKAETLVGAMYATGHCVTRDLPTAYRWFARALRQDPGNARLARDLEILWKQMTPEERQIAQRSEQ
jgi:hypothetical protein